MIFKLFNCEHVLIRTDTFARHSTPMNCKHYSPINLHIFAEPFHLLTTANFYEKLNYCMISLNGLKIPEIIVFYLEQS